MHGWLLKDIQAVKLEVLAMLAINPLKLNNAINDFLINPNIIFFFQHICVNIRYIIFFN